MGTSALPYGPGTMINLTAKDDIDNVGAGRAAKGATLGRSYFAIPSPYSFHLLQKTSFKSELVLFLFKPKGLVCNHGLPCMELALPYVIFGLITYNFDKLISYRLRGLHAPRLSDAHTSLFRRHTPFTYSNKYFPK